MRRLAVVAFTLLTVGALPADGNLEPALAPGGEQPPALKSLAELGILQVLEAQRPIRPKPPRGPHGPVTTGPCLRERSDEPCVRVCLQFVARGRCDRFPSATDGCLRFVTGGPRCAERDRSLPAAGRPAEIVPRP